MNLDKYGLPVQANGDANDQLNRVGMICIAYWFNFVDDATFISKLISPARLQPSYGIFSRFTGGNPNTVSADQLIPVIAFWAACGGANSIKSKHWVWAQNTHDTDPTKTAWKLPDFMFIRATPLKLRNTAFRYIGDLLLFWIVLGDWIYYKTDKDPVDINCILATIATCTLVKPTWISKLACKLWKKVRPNIYVDLQRYHRAESGGNPEIAEMWKPICDKLFV